MYTTITATQQITLPSQPALLTNVVNRTQGAGALTILSTNGNSGTNTGFIKMYVGTQVVYIPYWTTIAL
jgi:hypothetical protein